MDKKTTILASLSTLLILFALWQAWRYFRSGSTVTPVAGVLMLDVETNQRFTLDLDGSVRSWPAKSPFTGKLTGYPAEVCYWGKCRDVENGTWVVLNETRGLPGPTRCPTCGHEVVAHNPLPPDLYPGLQSAQKP